MTQNKRNAKGEGSFTENPDGTITHRKSVGYKRDGGRKILTITETSKAAALKAMKKKEAQWEKQKKLICIQNGSTVAELCSAHLQYQIDQEELRPKSIDRRECTIEKHIAVYPLGRTQVYAVKGRDIDEHIEKLIKETNLSDSSLEKVVDVLNAAYKWAIIRGELELNPVIAIKDSITKRIRRLKNKTANEADVIVLSPEEEQRFVTEALSLNPKTGKYKYRSGLYGVLLLYTGMRCGELLALRWRNVDIKSKLLTIEKSRSVAKNRKRSESDNKYIIVEGSTKNNKARIIELKDEAVDILNKISMESGFDESRMNELIVMTATGKPNTATNLEHRMATIFKNAGLEELSGGLHIFRRTFATRMFEAGVSTKEIAAYIGDLESTTERYYIAVRKKAIIDGEVKHVVKLPETKEKDLDKQEKKEEKRGMERGKVVWNH